jgi:Mrp family chromosome partitioning ATPase
VSKYYDLVNRNTATSRESLPSPRPRAKLVAKTRDLVERPARGITTTTTDQLALAETFFPEPLPRDLPAALARQDAIRQLSERMAPTAAVEKSCRVAISGCRPRDGASSIAAALALDLSQRLSMRTILVDANLQSPSLHGVISNGSGNGSVTQITLDGSLQLRTTGWPRLTLATCCPQEDDDQRESALAELGSVINTFPAAVIDLGVARLDPRMVPLTRPTDPILLVVRYGQTERNELATTAAALRAADRTVAGVIFNARPSRLRTSASECLNHE